MDKALLITEVEKNPIICNTYSSYKDTVIKENAWTSYQCEWEWVVSHFLGHSCSSSYYAVTLHIQSKLSEHSL